MRVKTCKFSVSNFVISTLLHYKRSMKDLQLTKQQQLYLVSELKDVVDNYEAYELESPDDYNVVLALLTEIFNEDWNTQLPESVIDDYLAMYFKNELL